MLADGTYDVLVIDVDPDDRVGGGDVGVDLAVTSGPHRGAVVTVRWPVGERRPLDLLGLPGSLTVAGGRLRLHLDG